MLLGLLTFLAGVCCGLGLMSYILGSKIAAVEEELQQAWQR